MTDVATDIELLKRLDAVKVVFLQSTYRGVVEMAIEHYGQGNYEACTSLLDTLPSKMELLEKLVNILEGKPAHKTLKKIAEGKAESDAEKLKGLFSLGTHIAIELEKGNGEYLLLLQDVYERIGGLMVSMKVI